MHAVADQPLRHVGHHAKQGKLAEQEIVLDQILEFRHRPRRLSVAEFHAVARTQRMQPVEPHGHGWVRHWVAEQHGSGDAARLKRQRVLAQGAPLVIKIGELPAHHHHFGVRGKTRQSMAQTLGQRDVIGVVAHHVLRVAQRQSGVEQAGQAAGIWQAVDADAGIDQRAGLGDLQSVIGRAVVEDEQAPVGNGLGADAIDRLGQIGRAIFHR